MSSAWRSAVEYHARELTVSHAYALSLLADDADSFGRVKVDVGSLAYRGRCDLGVARRWITSLVSGGAIEKQRGGSYQIALRYLECPKGCICPRVTASITEGEPVDEAPDPFARIEPSAALVVADPSGIDVAGLTVRIQAAWRLAYSTELPGGVARKIVTDANEPEIAEAFERYLAGTKDHDPRFVSIPKFSLTWKSYLTPFHAEPKNVSAFKAAFGEDL